MVSGLSRKFLDWPNSFGVFRTVSWLSGQFLRYPESFGMDMSWKRRYSPYCKNFPDFGKNFPDSNDTLTRFLWLCGIPLGGSGNHTWAYMWGDGNHRKDQLILEWNIHLPLCSWPIHPARFSSSWLFSTYLSFGPSTLFHRSGAILPGLQDNLTITSENCCSIAMSEALWRGLGCCSPIWNIFSTSNAFFFRRI